MNLIDQSFLYLILMILSISYPLLNSFEKKIKFANYWKALFPSIIIMMMIFIPWDIWFTSVGVWSFNKNYIIGYFILNLPIEEWLFFIFIPFCCVFIHEVLNYYFPINILNLSSRFVRFFSIILFLISILFISKLYTFCVLIITAISVCVISFQNKIFINDLIRTYLVSLVPFLLVNGILTGSFNSPVVIYNSQEIINIRLFNIPLEDFLYCFSMLSVTILPYDILKKNLAL